MPMPLCWSKHSLHQTTLPVGRREDLAADKRQLFYIVKHRPPTATESDFDGKFLGNIGFHAKYKSRLLCICSGKYIKSIVAIRYHHIGGWRQEPMSLENTDEIQKNTVDERPQAVPANGNKFYLLPVGGLRSHFCESEWYEAWMIFHSLATINCDTDIWWQISQVLKVTCIQII